MQKEGAEKRVQRVLLSTVMKSTLLLTCTRISRTIIHRSPILTMKRFTKLTSVNSIISPAGLSWLPILAGDRIFYKYRIHEHQFHQLFCRTLLVDPKDLQPLSLTTLSRYEEQDCLRLRKSLSGGISVRALNVLQGTIIAACIPIFLVCPISNKKVNIFTTL